VEEVAADAAPVLVALLRGALAGDAGVCAAAAASGGPTCSPAPTPAPSHTMAAAAPAQPAPWTRFVAGTASGVAL